MPTLWGIDPDVLYPWTPRAGRKEIKAAEYEGDGEGRKLKRQAEYGGALEGAPVIMLSPLLEPDYLRIVAAREAYQKARARKAGGEDVEPMDAYPEDLISNTLRRSIHSFKVLKGPRGNLSLSGDWAKDEIKIRPFRIELFFDIASGGAYETSDVEGFTSPQESQPA